jgi:hypothetical protein
MYFLQKKILELTQQYYKAIRDNISFENLKTIFMKRKKLEKELFELKNKNNPDPGSDRENSSLNMKEEISM